MSNDSKTLVDEHPCTISTDSSTESIIHGLGGVTFWGAQTYMYINIVHFFACVVVVIIYCTLPEVKKNLYNRVVLRHNVSLLMLGGILTLLGFCQLSDCFFGDVVTRLLWLNLQYFTNATVFWLNVVCFDMTLMITRFCWIPASENREKDRKLTIYSILVWVGALVPTGMAAIFEFVPKIPDNFPLKANFTEASKGPRPVVNMYFFLVPAFTLFCNNLLFILTTCNIIRVQRSTKLAMNNQKNLLKKKYFLFLRLYLFMGAPWFFGTVLACLNKLVVLKVCRTVQPVLWLVMLASRKKIRERLTERFKRKRRSEAIAMGSNETINYRSKENLVSAKVRY